MSEAKTEALEETKPAKKAGKKEKVKKSLAREIIEWVVTIAAAVAIAFVVRTFIFEPVRVDGASMNDTLYNGEIMLVTKFDYLTADAPQRFDVVICHYPNRTTKGLFGIESELNFVKRIVGLPGDTVELREGYLYVNGEKYDEPYINDAYRSKSPGNGYSFAPYVVPEGQYFVMGDHRNNSNDSRFTGPLSRDMIVGHVRSVIWSTEKNPETGKGLWYNNRAIVNGLDFEKK